MQPVLLGHVGLRCANPTYKTSLKILVRCSTSLRFVPRLSRQRHSRSFERSLDHPTGCQCGFETYDPAEQFYDGLLRRHIVAGHQAETLNVYQLLLNILSVTLGIAAIPDMRSFVRKREIVKICARSPTVSLSNT
jgi:hypothetical protein